MMKVEAVVPLHRFEAVREALARRGADGARAMMRLLLITLGLACVSASCGREPAILRQNHKVVLVHRIDDALLASVAAEKSAVLAVTDEESTAFAAESRKRTEELARLRDELSGLITADGRAGEVEKLAAFDAAWTQLRDVDERLLALAVANSNIKATWLAAGDTTIALDRFLKAMKAMAAETTDAVALRELAAAQVAILQIQVTLTPHIASKDDGEMTRLEARMRSFGEAVEQALASARTHAPAAAQLAVTDATAAWADHQRLTAEVIRLSRLNTNVLSVDVSVHEKRRVTDECRTALDALLTEIRNATPATR